MRRVSTAAYGKSAVPTPSGISIKTRDCRPTADRRSAYQERASLVAMPIARPIRTMRLCP